MDGKYIFFFFEFQKTSKICASRPEYPLNGYFEDLDSSHYKQGIKAIEYR